MRSTSVHGGGSLLLPVPGFSQPDDVSCGPTCLAKVLEYWGDAGRLPDLMRRTRRNSDGGTLAVFLGLEALAHGYRVRMWSYNTWIFDPTWFGLDAKALRAKVRGRERVVRDPKMRAVLRGYDEFLSAGGIVSWRELTPRHLVSILRRGRPILTGLNSTYLYRQPRERPADLVDDDIGGMPTGHFVVICGYRRGGASFAVRDPSAHSPFSPAGRYVVPADRLINSILLGEGTYDDVLLEIWPRGRRRAPR